MVTDRLENGNLTAPETTAARSIYLPRPAAAPLPLALDRSPELAWRFHRQLERRFPTHPACANDGVAGYLEGAPSFWLHQERLTGATKLQLPFVNSNVGAIDIIRRPHPATLRC